MKDKTIIPKVNPLPPKPKKEGTDIPIFHSVEGHKESKKILAGMLVSFSKDGFGEYWPLYLGSNQIGSSTSQGNHILLAERSVSAVHAHIGIRRLNDGSIVYELMDKGSSTGTLLNGKDHSVYNNYMKLVNTDQINIGRYHLVFIALDNKELGLQMNKDFKGGSAITEDYTAQ